MPPKTPKKTPKKTKENTPRRRTRSKTTEDELEYTDDPDKIGDKLKKGGKPKEVPKDNTDKDKNEPTKEVVNDEVEEETVI